MTAPTMMTRMGQLFTSARGDYETPPDLFAEYDRIHGPFDLDAAANAANALCENWFGPDHPDPERRDALAVPWGPVYEPTYDPDSGRRLRMEPFPALVWLNPPYGRGVEKWVAKAAEEARAGRATTICLLASRTGTGWFQRHVWDAQRHIPRIGVEVHFLPGRLHFHLDGRDTGPAPFPSVVVFFRAGEVR